MRSLRVAVVIALLAGAPLAIGYEWIKPTEAGKKVRIATADEVAACQRIGTATATTKDRVLGLPRVDDVVEGELDSLARNQAATMGGDTAVADGAIRHGTRNYIVYRCNP